MQALFTVSLLRTIVHFVGQQDGALCPKRELPPNHGMTQRSLGGIVRGLDPFMPQRRPQPLAITVVVHGRFCSDKDLRVRDSK